jgi:hypothetical protein
MIHSRNPQFVSCSDSRLAQSFLCQFAPVETLQLGISGARRVRLGYLACSARLAAADRRWNIRSRSFLHNSPLLCHRRTALGHPKNTSGDNAWTVPFGGGVGRIMKLGFQSVNITAQLYGNALHPAGTSPWGLRLQFVLLFPKLTKEQEKALLEKKLQQLEREQPQKN